MQDSKALTGWRTDWLLLFHYWLWSFLLRYNYFIEGNWAFSEDSSMDGRNCSLSIPIGRGRKRGKRKMLKWKQIEFLKTRCFLSTTSYSKSRSKIGANCINLNLDKLLWLRLSFSVETKFNSWIKEFIYAEALFFIVLTCDISSSVCWVHFVDLFIVVRRSGFPNFLDCSWRASNTCIYIASCSPQCRIWSQGVWARGICVLDPHHTQPEVGLVWGVLSEYRWVVCGCDRRRQRKVQVKAAFGAFGTTEN